MTASPSPGDDLAAAMAARRELGPDYDEAFVDAVAARLQETLANRPSPEAHRQFDRSTVLAVSSMLAAIPLTGIAAGTTGLPGLLVAWVGLVLVNLVHVLRRP